MQPRNILITSFLLVAATANAQTTDSLAIGEQQLPPVEVRAVRAGSNTPFAKTEVSAKDIEKLNQGQDIPYLLQYTPSTVATSDAGTGIGYTALRVRGTDGTRMNVTLNGVPVNDAESQGTFFVNFGDIASSLSSVQIQRGVGASTNGAGAFGTTMSMSNMRQAAEAGVTFSNTYGSFNTWKHTLQAGTGLMKNGWQFDLRLSKIASDGYIDRSATDLKSLQLIAGWQATEKTSFRFLMMTGNEKTGQAWNGVPQDSLTTNRTYNELGMKADGSFYDNQTDNYQQDYYQFFADHKFSKYITGHMGLFLTRGRGYYQEYKVGESFADYGLPDLINPTGADTLTATDLIRQLWLDNHYYGTVFSLLYEKNKTQVSFGGAWTQYKGQHYGHVKWAEYGVPSDHRWYLLDAQKNDFNTYLKAQQTVGDKLIIYGDVQYRTVGYFMNGFRKNPTLRPAVTYNFINPKAGITYLLKNNSRNNQKVYASVAVANKEPNRDDFEAGATSVPKPEQLYDMEAGYEINKMKWSFGANYYYMHYIDQLVATGKINDVGAYTRTNVPESYRTGIELQAGVTPARWVRINANATFSQNRISNFTEYVDNYDDNTQVAATYASTDLAFSPSAVAGGVLSFSPLKSGQLELDVMGKYVGKQYLDNSGSDKKAIDAYSLADLRVRYNVKFKPFKELGIMLVANNVFDKKYVSNGYTFSYIAGGSTTTQNYYYPQAGLNWLATITMKW